MPRARYTCPRCGAAIQIGQQFCAHCALPLDPASLTAFYTARRAPAPPIARPPAPVPKRPLWHMAVVVILFLCVCSGVSSLVRGTPPSLPASSKAPATRVAQLAAIQPAISPPTATAAPAQPTDPPVPTPVPPTATPFAAQVGDTVQVAAWTVSLAKVAWADTVPGGTPGSVQHPHGRYWLVWVDARHNLMYKSAPSLQLEWQLRDDHGALTRELNSGFVQQPLLRLLGRDDLSTESAAGALVHPLLVFDLPAGAAPAELIVGEQKAGGGGAVTGFTLGGTQAVAAVIPTPRPPTAVPAAKAAPAVPKAAYTASASVSNTAPTWNSHVTVTGRLLQGGKPVAGATMETTWNYKTTVSGCDGITSAAGVANCERSISRATRGYTVVVDARFVDAGGNTLATTSTSFTPR